MTDTALPSTRKDGSFAASHGDLPFAHDPDLAPDTVVDGTAPLPPVVKTSPLTKPLAPPARVAKTLIDLEARRVVPLTYAVHEPGAPIPIAPRRTHDDVNEEALARDRNRKHLGIAALGIATVTALTIAYFASTDDPTTARVENTSASVAVTPVSATVPAAPPPAPTTLTMTPTPGMGPAFTPVAPLPKGPSGAAARGAAPPAPRPTTPLQRTR